jgi:hypothetical protein
MAGEHGGVGLTERMVGKKDRGRPSDQVSAHLALISMLRRLALRQTMMVGKKIAKSREKG